MQIVLLKQQMFPVMQMFFRGMKNNFVCMFDRFSEMFHDQY